MAINALIGDLVKQQQSLEQRRVDPRYPLNQTVDVTEIQKDGTSGTMDRHWGVDISFQGMGVMSLKKITDKRPVVIAIPDGKGARFAVSGNVVYTRQLIGGLFRCGIVFDFGN